MNHSKNLPPKKASEAAAESAPQKNAPPDDGLTELIVWSVPAVNRRLLICHAPGANGENPMNLVNVGVRDNSFFLKKMAVRARQVTERRFDYEGPLPRWRGDTGAFKRHPDA